MERQDFISVIFCFACAIFLIFIPIYMIYKLYTIKDLIDDDETVEENEFILSNTKTENIY